MIAIFLFSSRNADQSGKMSEAVTETLFGNKSPFLETLEVFVRKSAHFLIFTALGFCAANTVKQVVHKKKSIFAISLYIGSVYAATDELHQYFVPGRSCMWQDWLLDTAGVLSGIGAAFFISWAAGRIFGKKKT